MPTIERQIDALGGAHTSSEYGDGYSDALTDCLPIAADADALVGKVELLEALRVADDAIKEMFRYYDGGETRGSYDGKPERAQLRKAGYATSRAIARAMGDKS
jgi:hypothetical protein